MIAPNMANPTRNSRPVATENTGSLHSRSGMIGSTARPSWITNSPRRMAPPTASPMMTGDPQGYWVPPHTVTSRSAVALPMTSEAPR